MTINNCTCTTASNGGTPLNLKSLEEAIALIKSLDPVAAYMREKGFDPEEGCLMVVPKKLWEEKGMPERVYIKKSNFIDRLILIRPQELGINFNFEGGKNDN